GTDEIADFEPDGRRYLYRLGSGAIVQAYWSGADGKFVVPDGTNQVFSLLPRYENNPTTDMPDPKKLISNSRYDLVINGDQLANKNDTILIETIASGPQAGGVRINLNGEVVSFASTDIHNIVVYPGTGVNTVNVESLPANVHLGIYLAGGADDAVN